jgi:hypothetical protein
MYFFSDSPSFPCDYVFRLMSLYIIVIVWQGFRSENTDIQIVGTQLSDSDNSTDNRSDKSPENYTLKRVLKDATNGRI